MTLSVFCLCAKWCDTCEQFRPLFQQIAQFGAGHEFFWVDIETHEQFLEELDIENFPTIVMVGDGEPYFFGSVLPHLETLQRLCLAAKAGDLPAVQDALLCRVSETLMRQRGEFLSA